MSMILTGRERRKQRIRKKISGTTERPRLSVFRSLKHISAQVIDDGSGKTLCAASTYEKGLNSGVKTGNRSAAKLVGEAIAERAKSKGIEKVVFDRNGSIFHGRVKELADAARQKGLKF
ncbi:MAG: 50S ribosomal protein L18 [bacterium]